MVKNLKRLRLMYNMSQKEVAAAINKTQQSIVKYEKGKTMPDYYILKRLAELFNTSVEYLVDDEDRSSMTYAKLRIDTRSMRMLAIYNQSSPEEQDIIYDFIRLFEKRNKLPE